MKQKLISISIFILISIITGFEIYGLITTNKLAAGLKQESNAKSKQLAQLKRQRTTKQAAHQENIKKAQQQARKMDIIYGYIIGYLTTQNPKLLAKQASELPEFAALTVQYSDDAKVNCYYVLTTCQIENGFNLHRPGKHGEQGPAQLMAGTWQLYYKRFGYNPADYYDWRCNYRVAVAHLAELLRQNNGDIAAAIGQYNGGGRWANIASSRYHVKKFKIASRGINRLRVRRGI